MRFRVSAVLCMSPLVTALLASGDHFVLRPDRPRRIFRTLPLNTPSEGSSKGGEKR